jgi:hypothetical protein
VTDLGYLPSFSEVNVSAGKVSYLNLTLSRSSSITYTLSGYVTPGNASVVVGENIAVVMPSGYYNISLPAGKYAISVTDNGYFSETGVIDLSGNITRENFTLTAEPKTTSSKSLSYVNATGYNVTISSIAEGNGTISVQYNSTANGTLTVVIPYSHVKNVTIGEILNSTVYINGTRYSDFTVSISSQDGSYSVILTVRNLSNDPTLEWLYSPSAVLPKTTSPSSLPPYVLYAAIAIVIAVVAVATVTVVRRKR